MAIPYDETIKDIAKFIGLHIVLEVYAGLGIWNWLLKEEGINIIATDQNPLFDCQKDTFTDIQIISSVDAVIKYPTDILLMCWPPKYED